MKMNHFKHTGVKPDGTFEGRMGAVGTGLNINHGDGCGSRGCHCSDGYWFLIGIPRTADGVVEGMNVKFEDRQEYETFIQAVKEATNGNR